MAQDEIIPIERILSRIYLIRDQKVMLDQDLAELYDVETRNLTRAVRRNQDRFPEDFMFQLTKEEFDNLRSQIGTSSWGGRRYPPYAFTENGVAMLSGVLQSKRAVQANIQIMRTFTKLRHMLNDYEELSKKLEAMERRYDKQFKVVFDALKRLLQNPVPKKRRIGFDEKPS